MVPHQEFFEPPHPFRRNWNMMFGDILLNWPGWYVSLIGTAFYPIWICKLSEKNVINYLQNLVCPYPPCNISDCFYCESCRGWQSWLTYTRCMRLLSYDFSRVTFSFWMVLRHISFVSSIGYCFLVLTFTWLGKLRNIATTKLVNSDK